MPLHIEITPKLTHARRFRAVLASDAEKIRALTTLDAAHDLLTTLYPRWFVYRGGRHVALHEYSGDDHRVMFVTEGGRARQ